MGRQGEDDVYVRRKLCAAKSFG